MIIVLVHGWSVSHTNTYGELAARLQADSAAGRIPPATIHDLYLGKYVSFSDEVRVEDISRAFEAALQRELKTAINQGERLAVITHSTGGPVIRDWWHRYYRTQNKPCPMDHLIMLAPANFGSSLAQLGKSRLASLKSSIVDGLEPGVGVLDWLEHGSAESWELNQSWIQDAQDPSTAPDPVYNFVLTGQTIDRHLYDHANSYTGELGSDGVVRVAAANLNASYVKLTQENHSASTNDKTVLTFDASRPVIAQKTAFALIRGRSHSGEGKGILRSIENNDKAHPSHRAIQRCLQVSTAHQYQILTTAFDRENETVRKSERLEETGRVIKRRYVHDAHGLVIARVRDDRGYVPETFDFKLNGSGNNPDNLPDGMIVDTQRNKRDPGTLTLFLNADAALGADQVLDRKNKVVRDALPGIKSFGLQVFPRPRDKFVGYALARLSSAVKHLASLVRRDETVLVDIELKRIVRRGTFELTRSQKSQSFKKQKPGTAVP